MVEMALITPILLVMLMVPADFGMMFSAAHQVQNATRSAARIAALTDPYNTVDAQAALTNGLAGFNVTNSNIEMFSAGYPNCAKSVQATVTIGYNFFFYRMMNWFGTNIEASLPVTRVTKMYYQHQPYDYTKPLLPMC